MSTAPGAQLHQHGHQLDRLFGQALNPLLPVGGIVAAQERLRGGPDQSLEHPLGKRGRLRHAAFLGLRSDKTASVGGLFSWARRLWGRTT